MSTTAARKRGKKIADDYLNLILRFPLRPIRSDGEYEQAMNIYRELADRAEARKTSAGENDYLDVLATTIRDYDEQHSSLLKDRTKTPPLEMLRDLVKEAGMNTVSLGKLVGGSGQASLILQGKRELSKANIRKLAEYFCVSPALFL
jgi:HTH-type transcriptional regulator/antitoxin HigA